MSDTGDGRAESPSDGEVTHRLATARRNCASAKSETQGRHHVLRAGGPLVTIVTQSLSSCLQKELLKAVFLIRHLQGFPHPTDSPKEWDRASFLTKGCSYLSDGKRDAWQIKQYMLTAFLPLLTQHTYPTFLYSIQNALT